MKKTLIYYILAFALLFVSCEESESTLKRLKAPVITELQEEYLIKQGSTLELTPIVTNDEKATYVWTLNGEEVSKEKEYTFSATEPGEYKIVLTVTNSAGDAIHAIKIVAYPKYQYGTFVLSEGNMGNETGTLSFIDFEGNAEDSIFIKANDGKKLGNAAQDMAIANGNIYIISQNGAKNGGLGHLVIADAGTAKLKAVVDEGFAGWTTNIAVPNDKNAFVVQSNGPMYIVDLTSNKVTGKVETENRFSKMSMVVMDNNVYAVAGKKIVKIDGDNGVVLKEAEFEGQIAGLVKTYRNELKVMVLGTENKIWTISKENMVKLARANLYDTSINSFTQRSFDVEAQPNYGFFILGNKGWNAALITYLNMGQGREIFSLPSPDFPNAEIIYGPLSINPETGNIYFGYVKDWSKYTNNGIAVISPDGKKIMDYNSNNEEASKKIDTRFCAGIYFTTPFSPNSN